MFTFLYCLKKKKKEPWVTGKDLNIFDANTTWYIPTAAVFIESQVTWAIVALLKTLACELLFRTQNTAVPLLHKVTRSSFLTPCSQI